MKEMPAEPPPEDPPAVIEDPEAPHHHAKSGMAWLDIGLAIAVLVLSGASLLTAQHTGHTMEQLVAENSRLVRANATPVLQFSSGNVGEDGKRLLTFTVSNVGSGAARIIWFELRDGDVVRPDVVALTGYVPKPDEREFTTSTVADTYLPAGAERTIIRWPLNGANAVQWQKLDRARFRTISVAACFCSVLGECWESRLKADLPKPVAACDARGHASFRG